MRQADHSIRVMVTASALLLTGCAGAGSRASDDRLYATPVIFDATRLLAPPPVDADAQARDMDAVRNAQRVRTPEQALEAEASSTVDVFLFAAVLGPGFTTERLPLTTAFFSRVYRSALPALQAAKDCWNRARPFVVDPGLMPLERSFASTRLRSAPAPVQTAPLPPADSPCTAPVGARVYSPSYPSGHATVGAMMAILLAEMVPEQRQGLFAQGWGYGEARVVSGVHFPSDVEAGRILGTVLVQLMQEEARFRVDLRGARSELRSVLGYRD
jgi:acid phosphatase (class A)